MERYFSVSYGTGSYRVIGGARTTIDTVWLSQMSWFAPGSIVTIEDDCGSCKTFRKE